MAKISWLGGVVAVSVLGGCFKPAIEREVLDDAEVEDVGGEGEVEVDAEDGGDTAEVDASETVGCEGASGLPCDDGDPCTRDDRCGSGGCEGIPYVCDDGLSCTEDQCDGVGGCSYPVAGGACLIGGACFAAGEVKADDPCRVCAGGQAWSPNDGGVCEDGDEVCTVGDRCEGLVCVGGPRPSDAATDWALRPLLTATPSNSQVHAVGRMVLDPAFLVSASGPATMTTPAGDRALAGRSVALLRRAPSGLVPLVLLDGFPELRVRASAPNLSGNILAFATSHRGAGTLETPADGVRDVIGDGTLIFEVEMTSGTVLRTDSPHSVDALAMLAVGGLVIGYEFVGDFDVPGQPGSVFSNLREDGRSLEDLAVVSTPRGLGEPWAAHIGSIDFIGSSSLCATPSGGVVVSTAFTGSAIIRHGQNSAESASASAFATYLIAFFDSDGALTAGLVPFSFEVDPESNGTILPGAPILSCSDGDAVVALPRALASNPDSGVYPLLGGPGERSTIARVLTDGHVDSLARLEGAAVTASAMVNGELMIAWLSGQGTASIQDAQDRSVVIHDNTTWTGAGLARFDAESRLLWSRPVVRDSAAFVSGVLQIPSRGIFLGGTSLFLPTTVVGADTELVLPLASDQSGFIAGLSTNRGLECEATLP